MEETPTISSISVSNLRRKYISMDKIFYHFSYTSVESKATRVSYDIYLSQMCIDLSTLPKYRHICSSNCGAIRKPRKGDYDASILG